jgi:hypothetical protein
MYQQTLTARDGIPSYYWNITAGSLPPGLSLDMYSGQISGIPTAGGAYKFTVELSDDGLVTARTYKEFTLTIPTTGVAVIDSWNNLYSGAPNKTSASNISVGSFSVGNGTQRLLLVSVVLEIGSNANPTISASYGGTNLTQLKITANNQREIVWLGYLKDSKIGSGPKDLKVSFGGAKGNASAMHVKWSSYSGVNQAAPFASSAAVNTESTKTAFGNTINYVKNGMTTVVAGNGGTPATGTLSATPAFTPGPPTTSNGHTSRTFTTAKHTANGSYPSSTAVSWSGTTSNRSALAVVSLQP